MRTKIKILKPAQLSSDMCPHILDWKPKTIILMLGCPGSGKSRSVDQLLWELPQFSESPEFKKIGVCSADHFYLSGQSGDESKYYWSKNFIKVAHEYCQNRCKLFIEQELDYIIIDNTNLTNKDRQPYYDLAKGAGYNIVLIEPISSWKYNAIECFKRNKHSVPLETISRMMHKLLKDKEINEKLECAEI